MQNNKHLNFASLFARLTPVFLLQKMSLSEELDTLEYAKILKFIILLQRVIVLNSCVL